MSHTVSFNFKQLAEECNAVCNRTEHNIEQFVRQISLLEASVSGVDTSEAKAYAQELRAVVVSLHDKLQTIRTEVDSSSKGGLWRGDSDSKTYVNRFALKDKVYDLSREVGRIVSTETSIINTMLQFISQERDKYLQKLIAERNNPQPNREWDSIEDPELRQFTYLAHLSNPNLIGEELMDAGRRMRDGNFETEKNRLRKEMQEAKVDSEDIQKALFEADSIAELNERASQAIVSEGLRKKALRKIKQCVEQRGFIVDKTNIRKNGDTVTMIAHKIGGETAIFRVNINGSFVYDFQGYEGQACQKDIEPFIKDLQEVYGVDLTDRKEIWSNPDKILTQKRQTMNSNHNRK